MVNPTALVGVIGLFSLVVACSSSQEDSKVSGVTAGNAPGSSGGSDLVVGVPEPTTSPGTGGPPPATDVTVVITADNAYGFGYGTANQLMNYFGGVENATSPEIFDCPIGHGPETYTVPAGKANVRSVPLHRWLRRSADDTGRDCKVLPRRRLSSVYRRRQLARLRDGDGLRPRVRRTNAGRHQRKDRRL